MCGILGAINFSPNQMDENNFRKALHYINHRGPDSNSSFSKENAIFGHVRLAIIDLDPRANQPFFSDNQRYIIIFNGEIYNYQSLRKGLRDQGIKFNTTSDTEVLLKGYIEEGPKFIDKCEGIFSLGIWDTESKELFLCRDRFGIKPLYYFHDAEKIFFSSEIKPILHLLGHYQVNYSVLSNFIRFRYHPGEETPFVGIETLPIGSWIKVKDGQIIKQVKYWSVDDFTNISRATESEALEGFEEKFSSSIKSQLIADVPVGVFLSGGVDSASVFSIANKINPNMHAFTLGLRTSEDEIELAKQICNSRNGTFHSTIIENEDFNIYKKTLWHLEEPLADSILSATYHLASFARKNVKVVLSGEGADEILGGYIHHNFLAKEEKLHHLHLDKALKHLLKFAPLGLLQAIFPYKAKLGKQGLKKLQQQVQFVGQWGLAYEKVIELFDENFMDSTIGSHDSLWQKLWEEHDKSTDFLNTLTRFDLKYWNSKYTLLRLDKLTMAHGLEARVPFLDSNLAAYTIALPQNFKLKNGQSKWILREAMRRYDHLNHQESFRKKQAFFLPIERTYGKKFIEFAADTLLSQRARERSLYSYKKLKEVVDSDYSELLPSKQLMALLISELWCQLFVDEEWRNFNDLHAS